MNIIPFSIAYYNLNCLLSNINNENYSIKYERKF